MFLTNLLNVNRVVCFNVSLFVSQVLNTYLETRQMETISECTLKDLSNDIALLLKLKIRVIIQRNAQYESGKDIYLSL